MAAPRLRLAAVATAALFTSACFTGERPTVADGQPVPTGDPAVDAVLDLLTADPDDSFTARYLITTKFGGAQTPAVVTQDAELGRSVTIGDVRYLVGPAGVNVRTCDLASGSCTSGTDESKVSDLLLTSSFYSASPAARLRQHAAAKVASPTASTESIAGRSATCVAVPVTGGTTTYCAVEPGILARMDTADLAIELTELTDTFDESLFAEDGPPLG